MANPFFNLQSRVQSLLLASGYYAGLVADQTVLTEKAGDLATAVERNILPLGFGLVITTPEGEPMAADFGLLISAEKLVVSIIHNPLMDPAHNALDGLWAAIEAVHGQPVTAAAPAVGRPFDFFAYAGHARVQDAPPELHVHELRLKIGARLL